MSRDERRRAVEAVEEACHVCRAVRASLVDSDVSLKADRSPVTVADLAAQAVVSRALADEPIMAEEEADFDEDVERRILQFVSGDVRGLIRRCNAGGDRFWALDPIDGTKGFVRGGQYAVALALIERGELRLGVLGCPNLDVLFVAERGQGTVERSLADGHERPVRVVTAAAPQFIESVDASHSDHSAAHRAAALVGALSPSIRMDSQAKYGIVARGEASVYLRVPTRAHPVENVWDHAAGAIVVEEAGGRVTDIRGAPLDWSRGRTLERNEGILATNGAVHDAVVEAVGRVRSG